MAKQDNGLWVLIRRFLAAHVGVTGKSACDGISHACGGILLAGAITGFAQRVMSDRTIAGVPEFDLDQRCVGFLRRYDPRFAGCQQYFVP